METPASESAGALVMPRVLSEEHRRRLVAVRNAVAEALAEAEELMDLLAPKTFHYHPEDYEAAVAQHQRREHTVALVRMELEHEADIIENHTDSEVGV